MGGDKEFTLQELSRIADGIRARHVRADSESRNPLSEKIADQISSFVKEARKKKQGIPVPDELFGVLLGWCRYSSGKKLKNVQELVVNDTDRIASGSDIEAYGRLYQRISDAYGMDVGIMKSTALKSVIADCKVRLSAEQIDILLQVFEEDAQEMDQDMEVIRNRRWLDDWMWRKSESVSSVNNNHQSILCGIAHCLTCQQIEKAWPILFSDSQKIGFVREWLENATPSRDSILFLRNMLSEFMQESKCESERATAYGLDQRLSDLLGKTRVKAPMPKKEKVPPPKRRELIF